MTDPDTHHLSIHIGGTNWMVSSYQPGRFVLFRDGAYLADLLWRGDSLAYEPIGGLEFQSWMKPPSQNVLKAIRLLLIEDVNAPHEVGP